MSEFELFLPLSMAFTKSPVGASTNYSLVGTDKKDITTIASSNGPVTVDALGERDQLTIQSTDGVANGFDISMGAGDDFVFADSDPNADGGNFIFTNSIIRGEDGNDILFGNEDGIESELRTNYLQYSTVLGGSGYDIIRTYGAISSKIDGGANRDKIELTNVFDRNADGTIADNTPDDPDRYDGAKVKGGSSADTIELELGKTNFVNSVINGGKGADIVTNYSVNDLSGDWYNTDTVIESSDFVDGGGTTFPDDNGITDTDGVNISKKSQKGLFETSTIKGGKGNDIVELRTDEGGFVSSSLLIYGNAGSDTIYSGVGNDTVSGGTGSDYISAEGGANLIYADKINGGAAGNDLVVINDANTAANRQSQNTVSAGEGSDTVGIYTDGNNVVYGDSTRTSGSADYITITGDGNNLAYGDNGHDIVDVTGGGSNTVYGGKGRDSVTVDGTRQDGGGLDGDAYIFGMVGNDTLTVDNLAGAVSMDGANGSDVLTITSDISSAVLDGGIGADEMDVQNNEDRVTYVQENGDSVAATDVSNKNGEYYQDGTVITFGNGVDVITNFQANNTLATTLGDEGLNEDANAGEGGLWNGHDREQSTGVDANNDNYVSAESGMVFGRSYYLRGTLTNITPGREFQASTFTVDKYGNDAMIVTEGNNAPLTMNSNVVILEDFGSSVADLDNTNFNVSTFENLN